MAGGEVVLPVVIGLAVATTFARMRRRSWRARGDGVQGNEVYRVALIGAHGRAPRNK